MKKIKFTKETLGISFILILSAVLNFANIGIEGYGNGYYAAGVKSMTMSLKNFFFVSFDPAGFVTLDKPPLGFWIQAISAKIFGYSGWSILLPEAIAGVISVWLIYHIVKRSFGTAAGLISALCLAVTPVFVAASRNNTIDNLLIVTLLFACWALSIAAERGKFKYLAISLILVGVGFNIKMLQAYMVGPAFYITYLLSSAVPVKKRIKHLIIGTVILFAVSFSWAVIVDLVPAQNRPYVGGSTNNSVIELIIGHNGLERLGLSGASSRGNGGAGTNKQSSSQMPGIPGGAPNGNGQGINGGSFRHGDGNMTPPDGGQGRGQFGQNGMLQGSFGGQTPAGITRLFSKNILSDQIVWFIPFAVLGFIAAAIKEKLRFKLDNERKVSLALWIIWLVPEFIYFSFTTGLFHPYYLTMMAPPIAALTGIGITTMWQFYKESGWKAWLLPGAFLLEVLTNVLMLTYFYSSISTLVKDIIIGALIISTVSLIALAVQNLIRGKKNDFDDSNGKDIKLKKALAGVALAGILVTPFIGASAAITHSVNDTIPSAGLELLSSNQRGNFGGGNMDRNNSSTKLIEFLKNHKTNEKYLLVVSSSQSAQNIIVQTGESVMALGGFSGSDNTLTLDQFKELVKKGEVRYVLTGGMGGGSNSEIMNWVTKNGKAVSESVWKDSSIQNENTNASNKNLDSERQNFGRMGSEQLYDLKDAASSLK